MRAFTKKVGGLSVHELDIDETNGPVCCEVKGCDRMALERITMAGYPAAYLCAKCAHLWVRLWREFTTDREDVVLAEAA